MCADVSDEAEILGVIGITRKQGTFVVAGNAVREDRIADRDEVIVAIAVDYLIASPAGTDVINDHMVAVLDSDRIFRFPIATDAVVAYANMANDDIVGIFDQQRCP